MPSSAVITVLIAIFSLVAGIIGFFLRRTINRVDCNEQAIQDIRETYAKKDELRSVEQSSAQAVAKLEKRMEERFDSTDNEIKGMKRDHLLKEDFYREMTKLDGKLQKIYDLLIEERVK